MAQRTKEKQQPPTGDQVEQLTDAVLVLTEQVRCLRLSVDEIEAELGWTIRRKILEPNQSPFPCDASLLHDVLAEADQQWEHVRAGQQRPTYQPPTGLTETGAAPEDPSPTPARRQSRLW
jgi:hypothetical protein